MNKMKPAAKTAKGVLPAGMYADGGKVKAMPFKGKQDKGEEMAEAKAVKAGKVSPKAYMMREMAEEKAKGKTAAPAKLMATGKALAAGKMTPQQYANKKRG
ncbi:MAG: hypothetical protein HQ446_06285 [Polaromonas sp.]|nr:hypothetical protein [Polaromonas sp.]